MRIEPSVPTNRERRRHAAPRSPTGSNVCSTRAGPPQRVLATRKQCGGLGSNEFREAKGSARVGAIEISGGGRPPDDLSRLEGRSKAARSVPEEAGESDQEE